MASNPLIGTWRLVSVAVQDEDGQITYPFGQDAIGFITYTGDGHMAVQFGRADRPSLDSGDWLAAAATEIAAVARGYFAYCGTYELRAGEVVHHVDQSLMPNWIGGEQVRRVTFDGDTITLSTPPGQYGGRQQIVTLTWQRV